jgi:urease subunit beta
VATDPPHTPVGGLALGKGDIEINAGYPVTRMMVRNTGDRPVQVGSHFHFFEVNAALEFDRDRAFGQRLDIPASTALRFEPGDEKEVALVPYQGRRRVHGFNNLVDDWVGEDATGTHRPRRTQALERAERHGFKSRA